jgi:hypothetical protein
MATAPVISGFISAGSQSWPTGSYDCHHNQAENVEKLPSDHLRDCYNHQQ